MAFYAAKMKNDGFDLYFFIIIRQLTLQLRFLKNLAALYAMIPEIYIVKVVLCKKTNIFDLTIKYLDHRFLLTQLNSLTRSLYTVKNFMENGF